MYTVQCTLYTSDVKTGSNTGVAVCDYPQSEITPSGVNI